jgi:phenol 2-monooxygenase (NADPH)
LPLWLGGIGLGRRFPSFQVVQQPDAKPVHFADKLKSNGRWRVVILAGDISEQALFERLREVGRSIALPGSFIHMYTLKGEKVDSLIEILVIHAAPRKSVELLELHENFRPLDPEIGWDYYKVFVNDGSYHGGHGHAYK